METPSPVADRFGDRRFVVECVAAFFLGGALVIAGHGAADSLLHFMVEDSPAVMMTSPHDLFFARWKLGLVAGAPALVGWLAVVAHRLRARRPPGTLALVTYFAVPFVAMAAGLALHVATVRTLAAETSVGGVDPIFAVRELLPGRHALWWTFGAGVALLAFVLGRSRTRL